tara:strand:- start:10173 stop:10715 length:543 start_codon:yes stop_codon:yes gene_type:complete
MILTNTTNDFNTMSESMKYLQYATTEPEFGYTCKNRGYYNDTSYDDDDDVCEMCDINTTLYNCNKCGDSICDDNNCCMKFPHYYNTTFFVCMNCVDSISLKLILQIDLGKLELLKEKIRTGSTCNSVCSSRTNSSSSGCSNNTNSISSLSEVSIPDSHRARYDSSGSDEFMKIVQNTVFL